MTKTTAARRTLNVESLEGRALPAANITASLVGGVLRVVGTDAADTIVVRQEAGRVTVDGTAVNVAASAVNRVAVAGKGGNDVIDLSSTGDEVRMSATIDGGTGNDTIRGTAARDVIFGGTGTDRFVRQVSDTVVDAVRGEGVTTLRTVYDVAAARKAMDAAFTRVAADIAARVAEAQARIAEMMASMQRSTDSMTADIMRRLDSLNLSNNSVANLRVGQVLQFNAPSYYSSNLARVQGLRLAINSSTRMMAVQVPNTFYGMMSGKFTVSNGRIYFTATRSASTGVGLTVSRLSLQIFGYNGGVYMSVSHRTGSSMAAVINNTGFGSSGTNGFDALVRLA